MRFAVETWAPDFGAPVGGDVVGESEVEADLTVERDLDDWAPIASSVHPAATVLFVDGVERIDARVWLQGGAGGTAASPVDRRAARRRRQPAGRLCELGGGGRALRRAGHRRGG